MESRQVRKSGSRSGFSLVEVMIAAAILLLVLGGFLAVFVSAMRTQVMASDYYSATCIARNRIQRARSLEFASLPLMVESNATVDADGDAGPTGKFRRTTTVAAAGSNACVITVSVWFPVPNGRLSSASIDVRTMIAKDI
jgi:prepilin-type N-terminal cleavage/methylation domain-containing protein